MQASSPLFSTYPTNKADNRESNWGAHLFDVLFFFAGVKCGILFKCFLRFFLHGLQPVDELRGEERRLPPFFAIIPFSVFCLLTNLLVSRSKFNHNGYLGSYWSPILKQQEDQTKATTENLLLAILQSWPSWDGGNLTRNQRRCSYLITFGE